VGRRGVRRASGFLLPLLVQLLLLGVSIPHPVRESDEEQDAHEKASQ